MGVVDQALPAGRRTRLLEVHPHGHQQLATQGAGLLAQTLRVLERGVHVVDAAGADDDKQAIVRAAEDGMDVGASPQHHSHVLVGERKFVEQRVGRDQRHEPLDTLIANQVACCFHSHHRHPLYALGTVRKGPCLPALGSGTSG